MNEKIKYLIFCIETYKEQRNMTGAQTYELFKKYCFDNYILNNAAKLNIFFQICKKSFE